MQLSAAVEFLVAVAFSLSLLLLLLAVTPARTLPARVLEVVDGRREAVAFSALCVLCFGFAVSLLAILAVS